MITFEELTQKYPVQNVALYGACVVVPGSAFDPDWEVYLADKGCHCHFINLDQKPVVLVQRKDTRSNQSKRVVYAPENHGGDKKSMESKENRKLKGWLKGPSWSPEDEQRLLKRMQELTGYIKDRARQLVSEFPGRTANGIEQKYKKLLRAGKRKRAEAKPPEHIEKKASLDYLPFETLWTAVSGLGTDLQERTAVFYAAAVKAGWPVELVESIVSLCVELDGLRDYYDNNLAGKGEVNGVLEKLRKHKHAPSGEAMLPMEASK